MHLSGVGKQSEDRIFHCALLFVTETKKHRSIYFATYEKMCGAIETVVFAQGFCDRLDQYGYDKAGSLNYSAKHKLSG